MRGRKNPTAHQTPPNLPPCRVCGEQGTGFHYGVTACGACKGFFRRSLVRREPYVCIGNGSCVIGPETKRRKSCPKCRHEKCLSVGMSKEAIKTGRYSYIKKSHDIIEMIEHHFQHYVKRSDFPSDGTQPKASSRYVGSTRKKIRSSCALEKISEVRPLGGEFMELSPTKEEQRSKSAFQFQNSDFVNASALPTNQFSDLTIADTMRNDISEDISISNDSICPSSYGHHALIDANDELPSFCSEFGHHEFSNYFNSPSSITPSSTTAPSPYSTGSPVSDVSNSLASSAPISPYWQETSTYSDSPYSDLSLEDRQNNMAYLECDTSMEICYRQQGYHNVKNSSYNDQYYTTMTTNDNDKINSFINEMSFPFQAYSMGQNNDCLNTEKINEVLPYSKQDTVTHGVHLNHPHTPVSNELERLRRVSLDDASYTEDFLFPFHGFVADKALTKPTESPSSTGKNCSNESSDKATESRSIFKGYISSEVGDSCYWDLDNRALHVQNVNSINDVVINNDHFDPKEVKKIELSEPLHLLTTANESCIPPSTVSLQQDIIDVKNLWPCSDISETKQKHYSMISNELRFDPAISGDQCIGSNKSSHYFTEEALSTEQSNEQTLFSISTTFENSSLPLNFLNISLNATFTPASKVSDQKLDSDLAYFDTCFNQGLVSPTSEEILSQAKILDAESEAKSLDTESFDDDEILERWTPFSLCSEPPRSTEQEMDSETRTRFQETDNDYMNTPLPWCEFTEAELDDVVNSLKSSYQKHVILDNNLLSDEEIAEKLKTFLDILKLREQTYGKFAPIDREAYIKILEATGIDVDGRRDWFEINAKIMNRTLQKTIRFFRSVPGFRDICHEDKIVLAKSCMFEYTILSAFRGVSQEKQIVLDAEHKLAFNMDFIQVVAPEMKDHILDMFEFSKKLVDLKLSFEEVLILKAISIISPDRDKLQDYEKVDHIYWRLHCCLLLSLWRRRSSPMQCYAQIVSALTDLRGYSFTWRKIMCSFRRDILKLTKDIQVPLYLEMMFAKMDTSSDHELVA